MLSYSFLLFIHSLLRWLVLGSLLLAISRALQGHYTKAVFTATDNAIRHWAATIAHLQLMAGITIYTQSPVIRYFWSHRSEAIHERDTAFFALIHITLMLAAIVVITIGSSLAKRRTADAEKFHTILLWFIAALFLIIIAIPWPFSPLAARPWIRFI